MSDGLKLKYFVLKPKGGGPYHHASRAAMYAYADAIEEENAQLAEELRTWAGTEVSRAVQRPSGRGGMRDDE